MNDILCEKTISGKRIENFPIKLKNIINKPINVPVIEEERTKYQNLAEYDPLRNFDLKKQHYINVQMAYGDNYMIAKEKADKLFNSIFELEIKFKMGW